MEDPYSTLEAYRAILQCLEAAAGAIVTPNKKSSESPDSDVARTAAILKDVNVAEHTSKPTERRRSSHEIKHADAEKAVQMIHENVSAFADRLVPALQSPTSANGGEKSELERYRKELQTLRLDCNKCLLQLLNNRQSVAMRRLDELRQRDAEMEANVSHHFEKGRQELLAGLQQNGGQAKSFRPLSSILGDMVEDAKKARVAQDILLSLRFQGMDSRKHNIADTHGDTYEWIFSSPRAFRQKGIKADFTSWLETGNGVFWVTGQPGSGKSTLLKYVDDSSTTISKLQVWAKGFRLVKASHFFWIDGSPLQKSGAGLLRSLCFDILRQCPNLLPQFCEQRWNHRDKQAVQDWSVAELEQMLTRLQSVEFNVNGERVRFCFFIDGLDEYSGDFQELLHNVQHLASSHYIKICAASRPGNQFEDAFGRDPTHMLTMQDLTNDDIEKYVNDILGSDERFATMLREDRDAQCLLDDIVKRANGVFLWVHLVVVQLQRSLAGGDDLKSLRDKLDQFPSSLDDYFGHMLDAMDTFERQKAAQIFRVCIRARRPLALLAFAFLDQEGHLAVRAIESKELGKTEMDRLNESLKHLIETRGAELLEVVQDGGCSRVQFTHRTAQDFLSHNDMDTLFGERAGQDFSPLQTLCRMSLLTIRHLNLLIQPADKKQHYLRLVEDILDYAHDLETAENRAAYSELYQLEELLEQDGEIIAALDTNHSSPVLGLAIKQNLCLFIKQRTEQGPGTLQPVCKHPDRPLLSFALPVFQLRDQEPPVFQPEMVRILLRNGSDPNAMSWYHDEEANIERRASVWSLYLRMLHSFHKRPKVSLPVALSLVVTEAMLEAGANYVPSCLTEEGHKGEKEILSFVFGKEEAERLVHLRGQPVKTGRTGSGTVDKPAWAKGKSFLRRMSTGSHAD